MRLFLFAGAGTSVELGVPAMREMALDLLTHMSSASSDADFIEMLREQLEESAGDLELVIEYIDKLCDAGAILPRFGASVDAKLANAARITRAEIEWFVQHACERVRAQAAVALWGPLAECSSDLEVTIATTNYDRGIELACQRLGVPVIDGFGSFDDKEWAEWVGHEELGLRLLKLHGSTDWYQIQASARVVKLRHPMPLFGGVTLHIDNDALGALGSALVLPSREKRKNAFPFPHISHELFTAAKQADVAIFIGTSLRDPDIRSLAEECSTRIPTIVVGPAIPSSGELGLPSAQSVQDFASGFLIATLPTMIKTGSWMGSDPATRDVDPRTPVMILDQIVALSDPNNSEDTRCAAIEFLWDAEVRLGATELLPLIESAQGRVARDALALVPLSRDAAELMLTANRLAQASTDEGFRADVELLNQE